MTFGEITEVCPWDIMAGICEQDLYAPQTHEPRVYKSHEGFPTVGKTAGAGPGGDPVGGAKYIYVIRDPEDAFFSFFSFMPAYVGMKPGDVHVNTFCDAIFAGVSHSGQIWEHMLGWYEHRLNPNVLFIHFESLLEDLAGQIRIVAKFMGIDADEALLEKVTAQSSYKFMSRPENKHHFDDHFVFGNVRGMMRLPKEYEFKVGKVRKGGGKKGGSKVIPPYVLERLATRWAESVAPTIGFQSYDELRASVEAENRSRFA
mmetsp:Transcript_2320/g.6924  ORF Transcript_2320/g.6924 Transcript_2320/m.6924 type:complete len:259 (-) Transcript_2320:19-795(-)